jgi:hypothetical protein
VGQPGGAFRVSVAGVAINAEIGELASVYYDAIPWRMDGTAADVESSLESEVHRG